MTEVRYIEIQADEAGQRLDNYLIRVLKGVPKSHIYRIIRAGEVRVNKKRSAVSLRLAQGDLLRIPPIRLAKTKEVFVGDKLSQLLKKSILFEDKDLLVLNKPAGLAVHGGSGLTLGVIEALRNMRSDLTCLELVHRLDKETSGCLLCAKKRSMLRSLHALLAARAVQKTYWALLLHAWNDKNTVIVDKPLQKNILKSGERFVVIDPNGKPSLTQFKLLENYQGACLVEASPQTGRTHQIRVHAASLGHPIIGDEKYGDNKAIEALNASKHKLYLHALAIQFTLNGKNYLFEAALDQQFAATRAQLQTQGLVNHE